MKSFKFKINSKEYEVAIEDIVENTAHIQVNGLKYEVELEKKIEKPTPIVRKPRPQAVKNAPVEPKKPVASGNLRVVNAPLPGNILDVKVSAGDKVTKGTVVMIMEAMKMENNIMCNFDGIVSSVKVKVGQSVLQNEVLLEIE